MHRLRRSDNVIIANDGDHIFTGHYLHRLARRVNVLFRKAFENKLYAHLHQHNRAYAHRGCKGGALMGDAHANPSTRAQLTVTRCEHRAWRRCK